MKNKKKLNNVVLCYHGCVKNRSDALVFRESIDDFLTHIEYFRNLGYTFVLPSVYYQWREGNLPSIDYPIATIELDDGLESVKNMVPYFINDNIPFGLAIIGRRQRKKQPESDFLSWADIAEIVDTGLCELMSHTYNMHHLVVGDYSGDTRPFMEYPMWIDNGSVLYQDPSDTRIPYDFSIVDTYSLGFPLFGSDPATMYYKNGNLIGVDPIESEITFIANATHDVAVIRIWASLHRPFGAGYDVNVQISESGTILFDGIIKPKNYETRAQWQEREHISIILQTPFSVVSGNTYTLKFKTINAGAGCFLCYSLPDFSGNYSMKTTASSVVVGESEGCVLNTTTLETNNKAQVADYPAGATWEARPCFILGDGTGQYLDKTTFYNLVRDDLQKNNFMISNYMRALWTNTHIPVSFSDVKTPRYKSYGIWAENELNFTNADGTARQLLLDDINNHTEHYPENYGVFPLCGTDNNGNKVISKFQVYIDTTETLEVMAFKYSRIIGCRYPMTVDVSISDSRNGTYTKIATFQPNWAEYHEQEIEIDEISLATGYYWVKFETKNTTPYQSPALIYIYTSQSFIKRPYYIHGHIVNKSVLLSDNWGLIPAGASYVLEKWIRGESTTSFKADVWPNGVYNPAQAGAGIDYIFDFPMTIGEAYIYFSHAQKSNEPTPTEMVYPFGSYANAGTSTTDVKNIEDVSEELKQVFNDVGITRGLTIWPSVNRPVDILAEPAARHTKYSLGRMLIYGDIDIYHSLNNFDLFTGNRYFPASHNGVRWQSSIEPDAGGNATIERKYRILDFVAFDAYFFKSGGGIYKSQLSDGGTYITLDNGQAGLQPGDAIQGSVSGATANVVWSNDNPNNFILKINNLVGEFQYGDEVIRQSDNITFGTVDIFGSQFMPNYVSFLQSRGIKSLLIISNYNFAIYDIDPSLASEVVNNPANYVNAVVDAVNSGGFDGVTINLEGIPKADRDAATNFMRLVADEMHLINKEFHLTAPAKTGTSYDADWWTDWCDFNEIMKFCDAIKIMSYTESGDWSLPNPHAPTWFWDAVYSYMNRTVYYPLRVKILCGANSHGDIWENGIGSYDSYGGSVAYGLLNAGYFEDIDGELYWRTKSGSKECYAGSPLTIDRASKTAQENEYMGVGIWKLDDGDLELHWPDYVQIGDEKLEYVITLDDKFYNSNALFEHITIDNLDTYDSGNEYTENNGFKSKVSFNLVIDKDDKENLLNISHTFTRNSFIYFIDAIDDKKTLSFTSDGQLRTFKLDPFRNAIVKNGAGVIVNPDYIDNEKGVISFINSFAQNEQITIEVMFYKKYTLLDFPKYSVLGNDIYNVEFSIIETE